MIGSRTATALVGLLVGHLGSVVWAYFDALALFVFLPFVPFLLPSDRRVPREASPPIVPGLRLSNPKSVLRALSRDGRRLEAESGLRDRRRYRTN